MRRVYATAFLKQIEKGTAVNCFKFGKGLSHARIFLNRFNTWASTFRGDRLRLTVLKTRSKQHSRFDSRY